MYLFQQNQEDMFNLHPTICINLGFCHLSNVSKVVIIGSIPTKRLKVTQFNIEFMERQSGMADGGSVALSYYIILTLYLLLLLLIRCAYMLP